MKVEVGIERDPSHDGIVFLRQRMRAPVERIDEIDVGIAEVPDLIARIKEVAGIPEEPCPAIWYLGSPYSAASPAVQRTRYRQTCEASARLFERSILVYSPIAHTVAIDEQGQLESSDFEFWRDFDLGMIDRLTGLMVLMIDGWQDSKGLAAEIAHARATGKPVLWCEPDLFAGRVVGYALHEDTAPSPAEAT